MTQETKEWYDRAGLDLGVAKHLESTELFLEESHVKTAIQYAEEIIQWVDSIVK